MSEVKYLTENQKSLIEQSYPEKTVKDLATEIGASYPQAKRYLMKVGLKKGRGNRPHTPFNEQKVLVHGYVKRKHYNAFRKKVKELEQEFSKL